MRTLTAKLGAVLVRIFRSFFVGRSRNVKQAIYARLHSVGSLIAKLEGLLRVSRVFIDHFVDQFLDR